MQQCIQYYSAYEAQSKRESWGEKTLDLKTKNSRRSLCNLFAVKKPRVARTEMITPCEIGRTRLANHTSRATEALELPTYLPEIGGRVSFDWVRQKREEKNVKVTENEECAMVLNQRNAITSLLG